MRRSLLLSTFVMLAVLLAFGFARTGGVALAGTQNAPAYQDVTPEAGDDDATPEAGDDATPVAGDDTTGDDDATPGVVPTALP